MTEAQLALEQRFKNQTEQLDTANNREYVMNQAQLVLVRRFKDRALKLDTANSLETIRSKEQLVLQQRLKYQSLGLGQSKADVKSEQSAKNIEKVWEQATTPKR